MAAFCQQLNPLLVGRCAPALAPVGGGGIVTRLKGGQFICETVVAEVGLTAVLGKLVATAMAVFVVAFAVGSFGLGLAPSKVITAVLGVIGSHVTSGPHSTALQAKVDIIVAVVCAIVRDLVFLTS